MQIKITPIKMPVKVDPSCTGGYPVPSSHDPATAYRKSGIEGGSLEAIYRFTNPVTSPVGVGVYY
jgi:hypothetical protein